MREIIRFLRIFFLMSAIFSVNSYGSFAQILNSKELDSLATADLALFKVPGLAIGIIKNGNLIYNKSFGVRSLNRKDKVDGETLFGIASNTKAFTAAALGILVDDGKLKWDDKVTKYLPTFKLYDPLATKEITIRDLLCHRSGLATGDGDIMHDPDSTNFTVNDIIYNLRFIKPTYSFRSKFAYDNNLYLVAGKVISLVANMKLEDFITQQILNPLGMTNSSASYHGCQNNPNIIDAHKTINGTVKVVTRYTSEKDDAAGGIYANVEDMSKWLQLFLNGGKYGADLEKQLISKKTINELLTPQTIIPLGDPGVYKTHFGAYGLGWFLNDTKGYKQVFHTGEDVGMTSEVCMIPELDLGIIVLTNNESNADNAITYQILDGYLGIKDVDESAQAHKSLLLAEQAASKINMDILSNLQQARKINDGTKKYVGTYKDNWFGNVSINIDGKKLWFKSARSAQLKGELLPYKNSTFYIKWQNAELDADAFVSFSKYKNGKPMVITLNSVVPNTGNPFADMLFKRM